MRLRFGCNSTEQVWSKGADLVGQGCFLVQSNRATPFVMVCFQIWPHWFSSHGDSSRGDVRGASLVRMTSRSRAADDPTNRKRMEYCSCLAVFVRRYDNPVLDCHDIQGNLSICHVVSRCHYIQGILSIRHFASRCHYRRWCSLGRKRPWTHGAQPVGLRFWLDVRTGLYCRRL